MNHPEKRKDMLDLSTVPRERLMGQTENYFYLAPHPALRHAIAHYTITHAGNGAPGPQVAPVEQLAILPDISGCLVYSMKDVGRGTFWGATTQLVMVKKDLATAEQRFFVEFLPGGAEYIANMAMNDVGSGKYYAEDAVPELHALVRDCLLTFEDVGQMLNALECRLLQNMSFENENIKLNLLKLLCEEDTFTVRALAEKTGYSERHLRRVFNTWFGVPVKTCARVLRINRVAAAIGPGRSLTRLAQEAGYYDQSHFHHDFKAVCGVSPSQYIHSMSDFYREQYKFQGIVDGVDNR